MDETGVLTSFLLLDTCVPDKLPRLFSFIVSQILQMLPFPTFPDFLKTIKGYNGSFVSIIGHYFLKIHGLNIWGEALQIEML